MGDATHMSQFSAQPGDPLESADRAEAEREFQALATELDAGSDAFERLEEHEAPEPNLWERLKLAIALP